MTNKELLQMTPLDLTDWLIKNYVTEIPTNIESKEDMEKAGRLLGELTNKYSYLISLVTYAKISVREEKRKGSSNKEGSDNAIDRRDAIQNIADIVKMQYQAVSRMITVKKEINEEIHMSDSRGER